MKALHAAEADEGSAGFQRKVYTHLVLRLLAGVFILAVTVLFQLRLSRDIFEPSLGPLYVFAAVLFFVTLLSALVLRSVHRHGVFAVAQFLFDVLAVTFLVYLTGGVTSPFAFLYMAVIMAAAVLFQRRGSLFAASAATIAYGTLLDLQYFGWVSPIPFMGRTMPQASSGVYFYTIVVSAGAFFLVAFISGYLAEELQKSARLSAQKTRDLKRLESFYRRLVENLGAGLMTMDARGTITYANRAARNLLGAAEMRLEGQPLVHWLPGLKENPDLSGSTPGSMDEWGRGGIVSSEMSSAVEPLDASEHGPPEQGEDNAQGLPPVGTPKTEMSSAAQAMEIVQELPDGEKRSFVVTLSRLDSLECEDQKAERVIVFQDQTLLKALQEHMRRLEQLAFAGKMAGEIVHDIKNPLAAISGVVQMMEAQWEGDEVSRRLKDILVREIERLNSLVGRFLWIAREGKASERPEPVGVAETVRHVVEALTMSKHLSARHRVHLDVSESLTVHIVPRHLFHILWHLAANAAEACPNGGHIQIAAREYTDGSGRPGVLLKVSDNGPGVPADMAKKVFDPLFSTKEGHLGLGLSLVCRLVEEAGGWVRIGSSVAFPMCVRVFFPKA